MQFTVYMIYLAPKLSVVSIIGDFFEKIHLLSLNASIEAARTGEFGRGFAVAAEEIGKLAYQSANELKQISQVIGKKNEDVQSGSIIINKMVSFVSTLLGNVKHIQDNANKTLNEIGEQEKLKKIMNECTDIVKSKSIQISIAMPEQKRAIEDIVNTIETINKSVRDNILGAEELRENSIQLKGFSENLIKIFEKEECSNEKSL